MWNWQLAQHNSTYAQCHCRSKRSPGCVAAALNAACIKRLPDNPHSLSRDAQLAAVTAAADAKPPGQRRQQLWVHVEFIFARVSSGWHGNFKHPPRRGRLNILPLAAAAATAAPPAAATPPAPLLS